MRKRWLSLILLFAASMAAPVAGRAQAYPYTHARFLSINDSWQAPCGQVGDPTAQLAMSFQSIPAGGTVDLTCYQTPITLTADVFSPVTIPVTLILPPFQVTVTANVTIPANFTLVYQNGSSLAVGAGYLLTDNSTPVRSSAGFQYLVHQPATAPTLGATTGGALTPATYYYVITATTSAGETQASPEAHITLGSGQTGITLSWMADAGATGYNIYHGTSAGHESVYYTSSTNSYTDLGGTSTPGTPPAANTAWAYVGAGSLPTLYYQTVEQAGSGLPQEPVLNFAAGVTCVDNAGVSTDCTAAGGSPASPSGSVQYNNGGAFGATDSDYTVSTVTGAHIFGSNPTDSGTLDNYSVFFRMDSAGNGATFGVAPAGTLGTSAQGPIFALVNSTLNSGILCAPGTSSEGYCSFQQGTDSTDILTVKRHTDTGPWTMDFQSIWNSTGTVKQYRVGMRGNVYEQYIDMPAISSPGNPSGGCRFYTDSGTGLLTGLTSTGANCLPTTSSTPSGARVTLSTQQDITDSSATAISFDGSMYNNGPVWSGSTNPSRITANVDGVYNLTGQALFVANATGYRDLYILLNGTYTIVQARQAGDGTNGNFLNVATMYHLSAGDYVELFVYQNSGSSLGVESQARFSPILAAQWVGP